MNENEEMSSPPSRLSGVVNIEQPWQASAATVKAAQQEAAPQWSGDGVEPAFSALLTHPLTGNSEKRHDHIKQKAAKPCVFRARAHANQ